MLRSQARISKLASDDLQSKLTQAFGEREELARKLQLAEAALRDKVSGLDGRVYNCSVCSLRAFPVRYHTCSVQE